jgi:hypothetical protein
MRNIFIFCLAILILGACNRCNGCSDRRRPNATNTSAPPDTPAAQPPQVPVVRPAVNVYIENSGSMDGYVNGNTRFKGAIRDLLVLLRHYYGQENRVRIYFINSVIRETDTRTDLATFAQHINTYWRDTRDVRHSSNLNNIFQMILGKTDRESISILLSDCIYSISGQNAVGLLADEKSLTKNAFLERWRRDSLKLATTIVKMDSEFTGTYYDMKNQRTSLNGVIRPYYICVIGSNEMMRDFNSRIPLRDDSIDGFNNKYVISSGTTDNIYYSVLLSTDNVGRFRQTRRLSTREYVHGIEDINISSRNHGGGSNRFTFAVTVDLKNVPAEQDYLLNPENYMLNNNNFHIRDIKPVDKNAINPSDWNRIHAANPTHVIILEATGTALSDVKVSLKKQMPQWIAETNITNDQNIRSNLDKTFGIKYLIEGIADAYQIIYPNDRHFFEFEIKIRQ